MPEEGPTEFEQYVARQRKIRESGGDPPPDKVYTQPGPGRPGLSRPGGNLPKVTRPLRASSSKPPAPKPQKAPAKLEPLSASVTGRRLSTPGPSSSRAGAADVAAAAAGLAEAASKLARATAGSGAGRTGAPPPKELVASLHAAATSLRDAAPSFSPFGAAAAREMTPSGAARAAPPSRGGGRPRFAPVMPLPPSDPAGASAPVAVRVEGENGTAEVVRLPASRPGTSSGLGRFEPPPASPFATQRPGTSAGVPRPGTSSGGGGVGDKLFREAQRRLTPHERLATVFDPPGRGAHEVPLEEHRRTKYNEAVRLLKDKIYMKGPFAITQHFQALDADNSGVLEHGEFLKALELFNLGPCVTAEVAKMLLAVVDKDGSGAVDYQEFTEALRMGRVAYLPVTGRHRFGPDPELPFGDPKHDVPFGIMHDADRNLEAYDARIDALYKSLEETFHEFDSDGSGEIDYTEFIAAMHKLNEDRGLQLSNEEITNLFKAADYDCSGNISYGEFVKSFAGASGKRFIPEFLKPKIARRSQAGNPWDWQADNPYGEISKVGGSYG